MKNSKHLTVIYFILTLALACKPGGENQKEPDGDIRDMDLISVSPEQFQRNKMELQELSRQSFPQILRVSGTVDVPPENRAVVSAVQGGFVRDIKWLVGDQVKKGQRIAILESPAYLELQQAYLETQAELPALRAEFERQKTLFEENISSEKVFLQAQSAYRSAEARNTSLKGQLKLLHIPLPDSGAESLNSRSLVLAPISGDITRVSVRKGAFVSQAAEIVEIVNRDHLHLELKVYEKDIGKLRIGQPIRFKVPELSNTTYEAEIHLIGSSVDADRSVQVHAHLADGMGEDFLVGMYVQAEVLTGEEGAEPEAWAVPEGAVIQEGTSFFVLLLDSENPDGYQFRKVEVSPGRTSGGMTELQGMQGVSSQNKVLSSGAFSLIGS